MTQSQQKIQLSRVQLALLMLATVLFTAGATLATTNHIQTRNVTHTALSSQLPPKLVDGLSKSYALLKNVYMGDIDDAKLIDGALSGFLSGTNDQYTTYLNETDMKSLSESTDGSFEGIGVQVEAAGDYIRIITPLEDSPAQKVGLQTDDLIIAVDGKTTKNETLQEVSKRIRGKKGTVVTLTIMRQSSQFDVHVTRDTIPLTTVKGELAKENQTIGIVRITSFAKTTANEVKEVVQQLRQKGAKAFVVDVRSNPGGLLDAVADVISMFAKQNDIMFQMEDKQQGKVAHRVKAGVSFTITEPITVLMNKGSASAAEIFASAMQELKRGAVIGVTSFGKGTAQTVLPLTEKTGVKITHSKWLTPNGNWVHEKGVTPDEVVEAPKFTTYLFVNDRQLPTFKTQNDAVLNLQKVLQTLGYAVQLTSVYDDALEQQLKQFNQDHHIHAEQTLSVATAQKINALLRDKIMNEDTQLQKALERLNQERLK